MKNLVNEKDFVKIRNLKNHKFQQFQIYFLCENNIDDILKITFGDDPKLSDD